MKITTKPLRFLNKTTSNVSITNLTSQDPSPSVIYVIPAETSNSMTSSDPPKDNGRSGLSPISRDVLITVLSLVLLGVLVVLVWRGTIALLRYMRRRKQLEREDGAAAVSPEEQLQRRGVAVLGAPGGGLQAAQEIRMIMEAIERASEA